MSLIAPDFSPARRFRDVVAANKPLPIVGVINAYCAMLAQRAGHKAIYLSGAGVANASFGMPDLGMTSLDNVLEDARRVTSACDLPLLVDIDTGWGTAAGIARTMREMKRAGVAAVHIEDQVSAKRCGHRPGKELVTTSEMVDRIKAALDGGGHEIVLMARTDAAAAEGLQGAIDRSLKYVQAGAEMIFAEALRSADEFKTFCQAVRVPVLANLTEFGKTPILTRAELASTGIAMALYPLTAFRAMSRAAERVYRSLAGDRQGELLDSMQTRDELYAALNYHHYEQLIDQLPSRRQPEK